MNQPKEQYLPLRIVADMASPIGMYSHDALPLDGLLEYAAAHSNYDIVQRAEFPRGSDGRRRLPPMTDRVYNFRLPVKRIGHKTDEWYWAASWATFPRGFETTVDHWNRRTDFADPELQPVLLDTGWTQKLNVSGGRYKSYHCPLPQIVTPVVEWFCLGAPAKISRLLQRITHLGKKRGYGGGEVIRWTIYRSGDDFSCWRDGQPMRALPNRDGEYRRGYHRLRAPYWRHEDKNLAVLPGSRVANCAATG